LQLATDPIVFKSFVTKFGWKSVSVKNERFDFAICVKDYLWVC
jgi:hypothetical protein